MNHSRQIVVFALLLAAFTWGWLLGSANVDHCLSDWLNRWQTLIVGLLTFFGALYAAYLLVRQTAQTKEIENERRASRLRSLRSVLPLALSAVMDYVRDEAAILRDMKAGEPARSPTGIPAETIEILRESIEYTEPARDVVIRTILSDIQINQARMRTDIPSYINRSAVLTGAYLAGNLVRLTTLYALISALFRYARFEVDEVTATPTYDDMTTAAMQLFVFDDSDVMTLIRDRFGVTEDQTLAG